MAVHVGSVSVEVVPDAAGWSNRLRADILPDASAIGRELGQRIGQAAAEAASRAIRDGINDGINGADPTAGGARAGNKAGSAFARAFKTEVEAAIRSLPDVQINADTTEAELDIGIIREDLIALGDKKIGIDISGAQAIAEIAAIRARLLAIPNDKIEVNFDVAAALAALGKLEEAAHKIEVNLDPTSAQRTLLDLRAEVDAFKNLQIGVDITDTAALAELDRLQAQLTVIANTSPDIRVRLEATTFLAEFAALRAALTGIPDVEIKVDIPNLGATLSKLQADLRSVSKTLPDIQLNADSSRVEQTIVQVRDRIAHLAATITVDTNAQSVYDDIALLQTVLTRLDTETVNVNVKADVAKAIADLALVGAAAKAAGDAGSSGFGRMQLIAAAVFLLIPLIAGAIIALAGAFALLASPVLAIVVGLDGIKKAAEPLVAAFDKIKQSTSQAFEQGLGPAIQNIMVILPTLQVGLATTAITLSEMATQISSVTRNGANLDTIAHSFDLINVVLASLTPSIKTLTQNIIDLTSLGLQGMLSFGVQIQTVGNDWTSLITRLAASGTGADAVQALFQVLASLIGLIGPITELGAVLAAAFGPALATALDFIGATISVFARALDSLPGPIQTVVSILGIMGATFLILGGSLPSLSLAMTAVGVTALEMGTAFTAARVSAGLVPAVMAAASVGVSALGTAFLNMGRALLANPLGLIITGLVLAFSFLGQANADAAAKESEHANAVKTLAQALRDTGGAITANIVQLTAGKLATTETSDALKLLGIDATTASVAVANGGAAYDALVAQLNAAATAGQTFDGTQEGSVNQMDASNAAAVKLKAIFATLRGEFVDVAAANKALADSLNLTGFSLINGLASAQSLEKAFNTLKSTASDTAAKVTALKQALDALDGGVVSADDAAVKLEAAIGTLGKNFDDAKKSVNGHASALIMANGAIVNTTEAGRALSDNLSQIRDGMITAATTAFQAAGGLGNLQNASGAAAQQVQIARDAVIKFGTDAGLSAAQANTLADRLQLIPSLVTVLLEAKNFPQVTQQLEQIQGRLQQIPGKVDINIGAVDAEALKVLDALHIKITQNMDGTFTLHADDKTRPDLDKALQGIKDAQAVLPITAANKTAPAVAAAVQDIQTRKDALLPVSLNTSLVPPAAQAAAASVASTPAPMPVTPDTKAVVPGAQAAAGQVAGITATLNIEPGGLAFLRTAVDNIRLSIATPVNFSVGMTDNVTRQLQPLQALVQTPLSIPITATDVGAAGLINALRSNAVQLVNMPITAVDSGASGLINSLRGNAQTVSTMPISAEDSQARGVLGNLVAAVTGTTAIMHIDAVVDLATGKLTAFVAIVTGTTAIMKIDADPALANTKLSDLVAKIAGTTGVVKVNADTAGAEAAITNLARPRTTTLTVNIQTTGALPGNAMGNIIPAFANGGFQPMPANTAAIVPPGLPRIIGDRAYDDEAYIPINNSARSKALLGITANAMGFGLIPMASGGLLGVAQNVKSQQTSSFLNQAGSSLSSGNQTVEQKLDEVVAALKDIKPGPGSITVEDHSGNPVETARATQLALRLAR